MAPTRRVRRDLVFLLVVALGFSQIFRLLLAGRQGSAGSITLATMLPLVEHQQRGEEPTGKIDAAIAGNGSYPCVRDAGRCSDQDSFVRGFA